MTTYDGCWIRTKQKLKYIAYTRRYHETEPSSSELNQCAGKRHRCQRSTSDFNEFNTNCAPIKACNTGSRARSQANHIECLWCIYESGPWETSVVSTPVRSLASWRMHSCNLHIIIAKRRAGLIAVSEKSRMSRHKQMHPDPWSTHCSAFEKSDGAEKRYAEEEKKNAQTILFGKSPFHVHNGTSAPEIMHMYSICNTNATLSICALCNREWNEGAHID